MSDKQPSKWARIFSKVFAVIFAAKGGHQR
jgi:hypothetical protein